MAGVGSTVLLQPSEHTQGCASTLECKEQIHKHKKAICRVGDHTEKDL